MVTTPPSQVSWSRWLIVIPARLDSSRLKNKPLQPLGDRPLIVKTYENLSPLKEAGAHVVVATDHNDVLQCCQQHNVECMMTRSDHQSGTDRSFEVNQQLQYDYVLNVQGDEPFIDRTDLSKLMSCLEHHKDVDIATLVYKSHNHKAFENPNNVKAVRSQHEYALYFSRSPIPHPLATKTAETSDEPWFFWHHQGVYAYRAESLEHFCSLPRTYLEMTERLEQLRALEHGMSIQLVEAQHDSVGIDTPEDLEAAHAHL